MSVFKQVKLFIKKSNMLITYIIYKHISIHRNSTLRLDQTYQYTLLYFIPVVRD